MESPNLKKLSALVQIRGDSTLKNQPFRRKWKYRMYSPLTSSLISYCPNSHLTTRTLRLMKISSNLTKMMIKSSKSIRTVTITYKKGPNKMMFMILMMMKSNIKKTASFKIKQMNNNSKCIPNLKMRKRFNPKTSMNTMMEHI